MIKKPPGIEDIFPDRIDRWNHIVNTAKETFNTYNYREIIIPIMEYTEVFARGLGDDTDIVSKEMFSFEDRGGRNLTLRPEGTASVVRAYVENGEFNRLALNKFFYSGPMFRAERPQRGRLRQFNQFGAELFGSDDPYYDYEVIAMMDTIAQKAGIEDYELVLNSIGCSRCRTEYVRELRSYYEDHEDQLCADCRKRLPKNTLRLLDCKSEQCQPIKMKAPKLPDYLDEDCRSHHEEVKKYLDKRNISYREDPHLVRGLDYYIKTTFEFTTTRLGGQNAFAAGGRYDQLVEHFEGKATPAVGFAAGIERMFLLTEDQDMEKKSINAYIVHSGGDTLTVAFNMAEELRSKGLSVDFDPTGKGFKSQFKKADREGARFALVIGEDELANGTVTVKNLETGEQETVPSGDAGGKIS